MPVWNGAQTIVSLGWGKIDNDDRTDILSLIISTKPGTQSLPVNRLVNAAAATVLLVISTTVCTQYMFLYLKQRSVS